MKNTKHGSLTKNGLKIRIIAIIGFLAILSITYFAITSLAEKEFFIIPAELEEPEFEFEIADYNYNIFDDSEYMALIDREFMTYATGGQQGQTKVSISEENYSGYSEAVQLIITLVKAAQSGDADTYNSCFSKAFLKKEGKYADFTMQQIYDVVITEWDTVVEGSYLRTNIELDYKIRQNNGTLRNDMGSDASRKQYITVTTNNSDGVAKIDAIDVVRYISPDELKPVGYNVTNIVIAAVISIVLVSGSSVGLLIAYKKTKKISDAE